MAEVMLCANAAAVHLISPVQETLALVLAVVPAEDPPRDVVIKPSHALYSSSSASAHCIASRAAPDFSGYLPMPVFQGS